MSKQIQRMHAWLCGLGVAIAITVCGPVRAADIAAQLKTVESEAHCFMAPGPDGSSQRAVCVWRPVKSPQGVLPVLYMADGLSGLQVAIVHLKPMIDAGQIKPFMIVATNAKDDPYERGAEYLPDFEGGPKAFNLHERWIINWVMPWAERTQGAAGDRDHRFIGGFSNGADYALAMAGRHPDLFAGALLHSPVRADSSWVAMTANSQRWVVTGGLEENSGSLKRGADVPRQIAGALSLKKAPLRLCIGRWSHAGRYWRQLSPGSISWLMGLGDWQSAQSDLERSSCKTQDKTP